MGFIECAAALAMVTGRAGGHDIAPDMLAASMAGVDMIEGQFRYFPTTVLAGVIIPPENLPAGHFIGDARSADHPLQADDAGDGKTLADGADFSAAIDEQMRFFSQNQTDGAMDVADVDGFKIGVQDQH